MSQQQGSDMDAQPQQVRRLIRRTDNKMVGGVAAGLGDYFGVDAVWFRLGFVLTTFLGGAGILAYIVMLVIMPGAEGTGPSSPERALERVANVMRSTPAWIGGALVALGALLVLNTAIAWRPGVLWGVALIVFGVIFFTQKPEPATRADLPPPVPPRGAAAATAVLDRPVGSSPPPLPRETPPSPAPRVRERSTLGLMTFGTLLVTLGTLILLDVQDVISLEPGQYLALTLGIVGLGLLIGSVFGRARWLIAPGILLVPLVLAASLIHVPFDGGFGQRNYRFTGVPAASTEYRLIAGEMIIDLTNAELGAGTYKIEATAVAGRIVFIVPPDRSLVIEARAGAGQISLFGQTFEGVNVDVRRTYRLATGASGDPLPATIEIDVEAGLGQVEVRS